MLTRLLLLFTVTIWGWSFVAAKICLDYLTPVELLGLRLLVGLPILLIIILVKGISFKFDKPLRLRMLAGSAILTVHFLLQVTGLKYTSATNTGWIIAIIPLVLVVLSCIFLKEKIGRREIFGIAVATIGIVLLISRGDISSIGGWLSSYGDWLILASAHTWAIYTVITRDISRARPPLIVTFVLMVPALFVTLIYMAFTSDWNRIVAVPAKPLVALLFLGVIALALAHWFWQEGISTIGAYKSGTFLYLEPIATTCLAVPLLNESFGIYTAVGGILVLAGVYWAQRRQRHSVERDC
ncbi:MAG: DMT family transporter [candidate division Zixibacteria bacterium]|nr:DMT family transporter [candidate division Zixibacteria bacterium]MBU1470910.1 DMT family transporter [candidate division Zixibacteria bacterium]MBU2624288.1 DMT family transporter [candidate division Zixibacteria bacterium]